MKPQAAGFRFEVLAEDGRARRSRLVTPHAVVELPTFMPVGTQATVKTLTPGDVERTGARIVLGNTYHLWVRPGEDLIAKLGGLHAFSRWPHAMLTDSGGFQAFSLGQGASHSSLVRLVEEGVHFRCHLDGRPLFLSPEKAVEVQGKLGADIQMQLDVCPPGLSDQKTIREAVDRTTRWATRALRTPRPDGQALFGIIQGGSHVDMRLEHAQALAELSPGFDGLALGGFSVGEPIEQMWDTLAQVAHKVDAERPRYLMGVGTPRDLIEGVRAGVDMFDCVLPTRNARNGQALTRYGKLVVKQAQYREDRLPLDPSCTCEACSGGYSRAYLRHLYLAGEVLVLRLLSVHNLHFYAELMAMARHAIEKRRFEAFRREALDNLQRGPST